MNPAPASRLSALRTGVGLTPSSAAISFASILAPGGIAPERTRSISVRNMLSVIEGRPDIRSAVVYSRNNADAAVFAEIGLKPTRCPHACASVQLAERCARSKFRVNQKYVIALPDSTGDCYSLRLIDPVEILFVNFGISSITLVH